MEEQKMEQKKLSYEELEKVAVQLQQKCRTLENNLRNIDMTSIRLNFILKALEVKEVFSKEFIDKCSKEVEEILFEDEPKEVEVEEVK